jgi:cytochrome c biogenesis protein CcmG/thiol:disulfide interchange protein DsbE
MKYAALLLFLLVLSPWFASSAVAQSETVAAMSLDELDGSVTKMSDYLRTGPVYLSFWALWCEPCKQELRALKAIARSLEDRPVTIIAVNQDSPKSVHEVKAYIRSRGITFPVVLDPNKQVFQAFNGQNLPFSVLIDATGKVVKTRTGYLPGDEKEIEKDILRLLR